MESTYSQLAWIIPISPLIAFLILLSVGRQLKQYGGYLAVLASLVSFTISVLIFIERTGNEMQNYTWNDWEWLSVDTVTLTMGFEINNLNTLMLLIVSFVSLLVNLYSIGYMKDDDRINVYFSYIALFTFSMLGLVITENIVQLYIFWELVGVCSFLLVGFWYFKPEAKAAAKKAFIVTRIGDVGLFIAILILFWYMPDHSLSFSAISNAFEQKAIEPGIVTLIAILIFIGAMGKSGQFPLHTWLPDAMEGPTPISALIHAATMVAAGVYLVARTFPIFEASATAMTVVAIVGAFTALFAATIGVAQNDIKRVLAYSTVSQLGYMMLALGVGALSAGMFHLFTHAFFKALLFLAAGSVIHAVHKQNMHEMGGLGVKMKITAWTFAIGALALSGIFPFAGFWSKDAILTEALHQNVWYFIVGLTAAFFTAFYMSRLFFLVFAGKSRTDHKGHEPHESPAVMTIPLIVLAVLAIGAGFVFTPFNPWFGEWLTGTAEEHTNWTVIILSNLVGLLGIGLGYLMYIRGTIARDVISSRAPGLSRLVANKYYMDELYQMIIITPLKGLGYVLRLFDYYVIDGAVRLSASSALYVGRLGARMQNGQLQAYGLASLIGIVLLMIIFVGRRFWNVG
ncbi:MAG: NADH-quinone oxidoreductase subunit L [Paenibacillaceae bacterium]